MNDKITEALDAMNAARAAWKSGSTDRVTALALHDNWLEACAYWRALLTAEAAAKKGG